MESPEEGDAPQIHEDRGLLRFLMVLLLGVGIGVLATGYLLKWTPIKRDLPIKPDLPIKADFVLTVDSSATTIKMVDEQGNWIGEISNWTADPIVVQIQRHR